MTATPPPDAPADAPVIPDTDAAGTRIETPADQTATRCPAATTTQAYETNGGHWHVIGGRCNRWQCPSCGPIRTKILCRRLASGRPNRLLTLTCGRPAGREPAEVWDHTRRQVPELIRKLRKSYGPIEYARVMELHKSGYPHYHLLVRSNWLDQQDVSRIWESLTDAFIVDIRRIIPDRGVEKYVAKYLTKQLAVPFSRQRMTASRGYFPPISPKDRSDWHFVERSQEWLHIRDYLERYYPDAELDWISPAHCTISRNDGPHAGSVVAEIYSSEQARIFGHAPPAATEWNDDDPF